MITSDMGWAHLPLPLKVLISLSILAAGAAPITYLWMFGARPSTNHEAWGQFGDFLGGTLNPIFSLSALVALLYTLVLQSRELRQSTEQLERSAKALDAQNTVLRKQSFEATFFQLLRLYSEVVQDLAVELERLNERRGVMERTKFEDRDCLAALYRELIEAYLSSVQRGDELGARNEGISKQYEKFYVRYGHLIGHYFRTIYNVVKFVDRAELPQEVRKEYVNILRAQLSKYELGLLLYNAASPYGQEKMGPLINKYEILKHLEDRVLLSPDDRSLV
jgi:hypothetical protein